ncbi:hypothetical protein GCM10009106_09320 [Sphingomonas japonica]
MQRDAARMRLRETAATVGRRLNPRSMAQDAVEGVRDKAVAVAGDAADEVRRRPAMAVAGISLLLAFIARRRIRRRRALEENETG